MRHIIAATAIMFVAVARLSIADPTATTTTQPATQPQKPYIGIKVVDFSQSSIPKTGVRVIDVAIGSPAEDIGLQTDDVIVSVAWQKISSTKDYDKAVSKMTPGAKVLFSVMRAVDGKYKQSQAPLKVGEETVATEATEEDFDIEAVRQKIDDADFLVKLILDDEGREIARNGSISERSKAQQKEAQARSDRYLQAKTNWEKKLPAAEDVVGLLEGKTLAEAEKVLGTKLKSKFMTKERNEYKLNTPKYLVSFYVNSDTKKVEDVSVTR